MSKKNEKILASGEGGERRWWHVHIRTGVGMRLGIILIDGNENLYMAFCGDLKCGNNEVIMELGLLAGSGDYGKFEFLIIKSYFIFVFITSVYVIYNIIITLLLIYLH